MLFNDYNLLVSRLHKLSVTRFARTANLNIFLTPREVGVNLKQGYNGDLSARDAGRIGGQMVKKLIQQAENQMK